MMEWIQANGAWLLQMAGTVLVAFVTSWITAGFRIRGDKAIQVHKQQFEKEFTIHEQLWVLAREVQAACDVFDCMPLAWETPAVLEERMHDLETTTGRLVALNRDLSPFFPEKLCRIGDEIHADVMRLVSDVRHIIWYANQEQLSEKLEDAVQKQLKDIRFKMERLKKGIKDRLRSK